MHAAGPAAHQVRADVLAEPAPVQADGHVTASAQAYGHADAKSESSDTKYGNSETEFDSSDAKQDHTDTKHSSVDEAHGHADVKYESSVTKYGNSKTEFDSYGAKQDRADTKVGSVDEARFCSSESHTGNDEILDFHTLPPYSDNWLAQRSSHTILAGLQNQDYNGKGGIVLGPAPDGQRVMVKLAGTDKTVKVKLVNMKQYVFEASADVCPTCGDYIDLTAVPRCECDG